MKFMFLMIKPSNVSFPHVLVVVNNTGVLRVKFQYEIYILSVKMAQCTTTMSTFEQRI